MKLYNALIKKNEEGKIADVVLLKEGFSFFAFLFSGLWFLYHRMWVEFLALILINITFAFLGNFSSDFDKIFLEVAFIFILAINANHWLCDHLRKKNYQFVGLVFGTNCENAKLRFIKNFESDSPEFDDAILNPKLYRKMTKLSKLKSRLAR
jgi:hypothetical protein